MCGITGFIASTFSKHDLERMTTAIHRRGPDAAGYYYDAEKNVALGHRRLSIIDLSEAANQPFYSESGRYIMVFNGEIYNFLDLKQQYNLQPRTHSDTEIVLLLFEKIGTDCFNLFNGMFAIAIWDNHENRLILARDRVGKKPLYYSTHNNQFIFASELKAITALTPQKPDFKALPLYLHLGYMPGTHSFYKNVSKLQSGHWLIWKNNQVETKAFWKIEDHLLKNKNIQEQDALKKLEQILETSVAYRLIADVPLGTFLSGGIDSSLVTALAQKQKSSSIKTFSIGFKESKFNESMYAKKVADHLKTDHHEFILSSDDAKNLVAGLIDIYDEPYTDSSSIPTLLVSEMARKHVTVALSGDGGDELFLGYGRYDWAERFNQFPYSVFHQWMGAGMKMFGNNRFKRIGEVLSYSAQTYLPAHIFSQEEYLFSLSEIKEMLYESNPGLTFTPDDFDMPSLNNLNSSELQSLFDFKNYLQEDLMIKVDRASMHHSLEVRAPLLDYRLVEFAYSLPASLRKKEQTSKYLLKQVLYKHVPKEIFDRPKWGFSFPLENWLKTDLNFLITTYLHPDVIAQFKIIKPEFVAQLIARFNAGENYLYNRIWALIQLHQWMMKTQQKA